MFPLDSPTKTSYHVVVSYFPKVGFMQTRRLDDSTVLIEMEGESIIVLYPKSTSSADIAQACLESASRLERKAKLYRAFGTLLAKGTQI